ncbi:MAG TPA: plasmid pRiA4b ORF-3 family protein [Pseudonocardiaceae bacterium]|jgi:hypothetical protein
MSPVSRRRRAKKSRKSARWSASAATPALRAECDCPSCSAGFDPRQLIDDLTSDEGLNESADPLQAEVMAATLLSIGELVGEPFEEALIGGLIPDFEAKATTGALAMLLAIASVSDDRMAKAASVAADRLIAAGLAQPSWAAELDEPLTVGDCWRFVDPRRTASMLVCSFHRAGRSHAMVMSVNHLDCGAADTVQLADTDQLPAVIKLIRASGEDFEIRQMALDPAEFRWQVESALDARAVHDSGPSLFRAGAAAADDDESLSYPAMALLLRARMRALPAPDRTKAQHGNGDDQLIQPAAMELLTRLAGAGRGPLGALPSADARGRTAVGAMLPAKRRKSEGPVPVYQLKVALRGAKPPIWRRLEVPADTSLARLHEIIQVAFDWYDCHLHVFETPYGEFGAADAELGHRPAASVTLEQVAPGAGSKIRYTYDFGDDWQHDIQVEKVLDRNAAASYPRCTGGRRAAPPEDCGGVWGYADLERILADPDHPEHDDMLQWLGLDDATDFDPDAFDAAAVTKALSSGAR